MEKAKRIRTKYDSLGARLDGRSKSLHDELVTILPF
jgi:hypothetical protein